MRSNVNIWVTFILVYLYCICYKLVIVTFCLLSPHVTFCFLIVSCFVHVCWLCCCWWQSFVGFHINKEFEFEFRYAKYKCCSMSQTIDVVCCQLVTNRVLNYFDLMNFAFIVEIFTEICRLIFDRSRMNLIKTQIRFWNSLHYVCSKSKDWKTK